VGRRGPRVRIGAALAVALLAALVACDPPTDTPEPPPAAQTRADPPDTADPPPTPSPTTAPPPAPEFDQLAQQVSAVRGLPVLGPIEPRLLSVEQLGDKVSELIREDLDVVELDEARRILVPLRLVAPDLDLLAVLAALYREQILGLYVPKENTLYVRIGEGELTPSERLTAAHEVAHALQDQSYDLEALRDLPTHEADAELAVTSLIEGDAVLTQQVWSARYQTDEERQQIHTEALDIDTEALDRAPRYIREALFFPYREGAAFVQALVNHGGIEAVDKAFVDPPTTTAQILHPERYLAGIGAVEVTVSGSPGDGWEGPRTYTFGEFDLRELLVPLGRERAASAAAGWAGGMVAGWRRGGEDAVAVAFAFDSEPQMAQACDAVRDWYRSVASGAGDGVLVGDRDVMAYVCEDGHVRFGIAPDAETAARLLR
jgi:hypothetical protein